MSRDKRKPVHQDEKEETSMIKTTVTVHRDFDVPTYEIEFDHNGFKYHIEMESDGTVALFQISEAKGEHTRP